MSSPNIDIPSPARTPSDSSCSLSDRINIATRPVHTTLNKQILARLPLALPPHTTNPSTYVSGLLHVAPIYITFESLWQSLIEAPLLPTDLTLSIPVEPPSTPSPILESKVAPLMTSPDAPLRPDFKICRRTKFLLSHLRLPGLLRSSRLRNDIRVLSGTPAYEIEQQLAVVALKGQLAEFISHTKRSVSAKPHVLLAYAWVLYMALFSGGRHLRAALKAAGGAGPNFWDRDPSPIRPYSMTQRPRNSRRQSTNSENPGPPPISPEEDTGPPLRPSVRTHTRSDNDASGLVPGMEFFNFPGSEDGEDIKILFKARIAESEILLSSGEKEDVITEAQHIFTFMVQLISDLDTVMGTPRAEAGSCLKVARAPVISRDNIDLAQERVKGLKVSSSGSEARQDGDEKIKDKADTERRPSYMDILILGPVNYLIRFKGTKVAWDAVVKPLSHLVSREEGDGPSVSFMASEGHIFHEHESTAKTGGDKSLFLVMMSISAFLVVVIAWLITIDGVGGGRGTKMVGAEI